jgi:hypothetical protein
LRGRERISTQEVRIGKKGDGVPGAAKPQPGNSKSEIRNPKQIRMTKIQNKANKIEQKKQNSDGE